MLVVSLLMTAACAVDQPSPEPTRKANTIDLAILDPQATLEEDQSPDLCALAADLPADDMCSLICDPDALEQAIVDGGAAGGRCYTLVCPLSDAVTVSVGVCIL